MAAESEDARRIADWPLLGWTVLFALVSLGMIFRGEDAAYHLNPAPIDGTLHLFNSLRRIAHGESAGADFQVYHGVLLPYLFYPAFRIGGTSFFGVELARQLYTPLALVVGYLAVFAALTRSLRTTLCLSTIALLASVAFRASTLLVPGSSEFGVRTMPVLLVVAFFASRRGADRVLLRRALDGAAIGAAIVAATEQGLALAAAYIVVRGIELWRSEHRRRDVLYLALSAVCAFIAVLVILFVIGGWHGMLAALAYNFRAVPQDQFWYFGAPPSAFLGRWTQLLASPRIAIALILSAVNAVWWTSRIPRERAVHPRRASALAILAVYGVLSNFPLLARFVTGYTDAAVRVLIITTLYALHTGAARRLVRRGITPRWPAFATGLLVVLATLTNVELTAAIIAAPWHFIRHHVLGGEAPQLANDWKAALQAGQVVISGREMRTGRAPTLWSTYSGPLDAINNSYNPSFDYAIDALGKENRAAYIDAFRRTQPDVVQTISPAYSLFEEWMEVTRWDLYHELLTHYGVAAVGPWSIFWERLPNVAARDTLLTQWVRAPGEKSRGVGFRFARAPGLNLFEVELDYAISNPYRFLPVVGQLPHFMIVIDGALNSVPVPLAPYERTVRFPVLVRDASRISFTANVESLFPGPALEIRAVRVRGMPLSPLVTQWARLFAQAADAPRR